MNMRRAVESLQESPRAVNGGLGQKRSSPQPLAPTSTRNGVRPLNQGTHPDQDLEFVCDGEIPPLIPEGKYNVTFLGAEQKWLWGREKMFLHFQILDFGESQGEVLYMACNAPQKGKKGKVPTSCKYYQAWVLAAGRRPDRYDRMSTKVFRGKVFLAKVRRVNKNAQNSPRPLLLQYSIIDDLLDRLTNSEQI